MNSEQIFMVYQDAEENYHGGMYYDWDKVHADTFNPECIELCIIDFKTHGKTYEQKKEFIRKQAIDYQLASWNINMCYEEIAIIGDWFSTMARRYGLVKEFRENCII